MRHLSFSGWKAKQIRTKYFEDKEKLKMKKK